MKIDLTMPLSDVIKMLLKGEEQELVPKDLKGYVENLAGDDKEKLQQALKEVETAIKEWHDTYFVSTYEKRVNEWRQGKLKCDPSYLENLFFEEELLIKEGKKPLTIDTLHNTIKEIGFIDWNHRDAVETAWARDDMDFLMTQWINLSLWPIKALREAIIEVLGVVSPKTNNEVQRASRAEKTLIEFPEVFGVDVCCQVTGYKKNTIYKLVSKKEIPYFNPGNKGRKVMFRREEVLAWLTARRQKTNDEFINQMDEELAARKQIYYNN